MSRKTMEAAKVSMMITNRDGQKYAQTRELSSGSKMIDEEQWFSSNETMGTLLVMMANVVTLIEVIVSVANARDQRATCYKCLIYVRLLDVHPHHNLVAPMMIITIIIILIIAISLPLSLTGAVCTRQGSMKLLLRWLLRLCLGDSEPMDQFGDGRRECELTRGFRVWADLAFGQAFNGYNLSNEVEKCASERPMWTRRARKDLDSRQKSNNNNEVRHSDGNSLIRNSEASKSIGTSGIDRLSIAGAPLPSNKSRLDNSESDNAERHLSCVSLYLDIIDQNNFTSTRYTQNEPWQKVLLGSRQHANKTDVNSKISSRRVCVMLVSSLVFIVVGLSNVCCTRISALEHGNNATKLIGVNGAQAIPRIEPASDRKDFYQGDAPSFSQSSIQAVGNRWNFGQRLLALGAGLTSNMSPTLRESLTPGKNSAPTRASPTVSSVNPKKDYETTRLGDIVAERRLFSIGDENSNSSSGIKKLSSLARPNLSWDSWTKLLNFKDVNESLVAASKFRPLLARPNDSDNMKTGQTEAKVINVTPSDQSQGSSLKSDTSEGQVRKSAGLATSMGLITVPYPADGAKETLSTGIMMQPTANETFHNSNEIRSKFEHQPDWSASNSIEHVIYAGPVDGVEAKQEQAETRDKESASERALAGNLEMNQNGERSKGQDELGHWSSEKSGSEGKQSQEDKASKAADARLIDVGHDRHGWKNVYHKEEYAQHQKYHDVFRDKDWHNKASKYGQNHDEQTGSKFNESLAKSFTNQDKMGSKYDYQRGTSWKKSEEDEMMRHDDGDDHHQDSTEENDGKSINELANQRDHQNSGSSTSNTFDRPNSGDKLDDDAVLEQMKFRLENMSEQYGNEGLHGHESRKPSASNDNPETNEQTSADNGTSRVKSSVIGQQGWSRADLNEQTRDFGQTENLETRDRHLNPGNSTWTEGHNDGARTRLGKLKMEHEATGVWNNVETNSEPNAKKKTGLNQGLRQSEVKRDKSDRGNGDGNNGDDNDDDAKEAKIMVVKSGRRRNRPISEQVAESRGEDKREGLKLKLELNLDKSAMINQVPASGDQLYNYHKGQIVDVIPTSSLSPGRGLTNSLGHKIRSSFDRDRTLSWPLEKASTRPISGGPPVWQTTRIERNSHNSSVHQREPGHDFKISQQPSGGGRTKQSNPSSKDFHLISRYPAKAYTPVSQRSPMLSPSAGSQQQLTQSKHSTPNVYLSGLKVDPPELLGLRNKSRLLYSQSAVMKQQSLGGSPLGLYGDDFTIRGMPISNQLGLDPIENLNGIRSPLISSHNGQRTTHEYLLLIEKDRSGKDRNLARDMSGSEHFTSQLGGEFQARPTDSPVGLSGPSYQIISASGEPNIIFETAPSNIYDDDVLLDSQALPSIELHPAASSLNRNNNRDQLQFVDQRDHLLEQQQQQNWQQAELIDDQLIQDFSTAHMNYVAASSLPVQQLLLSRPLLTLGAVAVDLDPSGEGHSLIDSVRGGRHLVAPPMSGTNKLQPLPTTGRIRPLEAQKIRPKTLVTTKSPAHQAQQPSTSSMTAATSQSQTWPVIKTLRDHLNMMPLGGLLRTVSVTGPSSWSQSSIGRGRDHAPMPSPSISQDKQQSLAPANSVSSISPISKWFRLPLRVIDGQHPQQRLRRYKQAVTDQLAAAATNYSVSHHSPAVSFDIHRWRPLKEQTNLSSRTNMSIIPNSGDADPMQANFSFSRVSFLALNETKTAPRQHDQPARGQGRNKGSPQSDKAIRSQGQNIERITLQNDCPVQSQHQKITNRLRRTAQNQTRLKDTIRCGNMKRAKLPLISMASGDSSNRYGLKSSNRQHFVVRSASQTSLKPSSLIVDISNQQHNPIANSQHDNRVGTRHNKSGVIKHNHHHDQAHQRPQRLQPSATKSPSQDDRHFYKDQTIGSARLGPLVMRSSVSNTYHHPFLIEAQLPIQISHRDHISER